MEATTTREVRDLIRTIDGTERCLIYLDVARDATFEAWNHLEHYLVEDTSPRAMLLVEFRKFHGRCVDGDLARQYKALEERKWDAVSELSELVRRARGDADG